MLREVSGVIAVFDLGGTWFRWGRYRHPRGLLDCDRAPAINYLSHPALSACESQNALAEFVLTRVRVMRDSGHEPIDAVCISIGAPVNAHDQTVLGSGPLWGKSAQCFGLRAHLQRAMPDLEWNVVNDVTALLVPYMRGEALYSKTMLITVSSGIGSRLCDHRSGRIPYDGQHGIQGEIGHLVCSFELQGARLNRQCECGGWNHLNAFASGRGIAETLRRLPGLISNYGDMFDDAEEIWGKADDEHRASALREALRRGNEVAAGLLVAFVTPLARVIATAVTLDPDIERIVMTGGVVNGLGEYYKDALLGTLLREELYLITDRDPEYLRRRLHWQVADDFCGLLGAGLYATGLAREAHSGARN